MHERFFTSYSVTYCIYIPGKPGFCFHYYCAVYDECKYSDTFWFVDCVRLFVHYTIPLSSLCKLIWGHLTNKMPVRYILSSVWVRLGLFSQLSIIQYMGLCVFTLPIFLVMIERICTLSYYHNQIGSINYHPLFRVMSWNNDMRCMSLYILLLWAKCSVTPSCAFLSCLNVLLQETDCYLANVWRPSWSFWQFIRPPGYMETVCIFPLFATDALCHLPRWGNMMLPHQVPYRVNFCCMRPLLPEVGWGVWGWASRKNFACLRTWAASGMG